MSDKCDCGHGQHVHVGYTGGCGLCDTCTGFRITPQAAALTEQIAELLAEHRPLDKFDREGLSVTVSHVCSCDEWSHEPGSRWPESHRAHVASILAARLAGAGAQVTEAAVITAPMAECQSCGHPKVSHKPKGCVAHRGGRERVSERACPCTMFAPAALSAAALPHMGTGQSEADLRARISALADEAVARMAGFPKHKHWEAWSAHEADLRALLDRPAAEGDNRLAEAWDEGYEYGRPQPVSGKKGRGIALQRDGSDGDWTPGPRTTTNSDPNPYRRPAAAEGNET